MILRMLMLFACLSVMCSAEICMKEIQHQTFTHDPATEPIFQDSTFEGLVDASSIIMFFGIGDPL